VQRYDTPAIIRYSTPQEAATQNVAMQYAMMRYATVRYAELRYAAVRDAMVRDTALRCSEARYATVQYAAALCAFTRLSTSLPFLFLTIILSDGHMILSCCGCLLCLAAWPAIIVCFHSPLPSAFHIMHISDPILGAFFYSVDDGR
jgi:hypothetical protein